MTTPLLDPKDRPKWELMRFHPANGNLMDIQFEKRPNEFVPMMDMAMHLGLVMPLEKKWAKSKLPQEDNKRMIKLLSDRVAVVWPAMARQWKKDHALDAVRRSVKMVCDLVFLIYGIMEDILAISVVLPRVFVHTCVRA